MADDFTPNLNLDKPINGASADTWGLAIRANYDALDAMLGGAIYGLTLSAAGSTATFGIAAGGASGMALASAYTKTGASWAVGTGNGGIDTGAIANATWYHVWLIQRVDTSVVDVLFSLSATSPTMPTNYTRKRRIGSMLTNGSAQWVKFTQVGNQFLWDAPVRDVVATASVSTALLLTLSVPLGVQTDALFTAQITYNASTDLFLATSPDQADTNPSTAPIYQQAVFSTNTQSFGPNYSLRTDTSSRIRARMTTSGGGAASCDYKIFTFGWIDRRGQ